MFTAAIAAVITLHSIPSGKYVIGGDAILPGFNPSVALAHLSNTWDTSAGFGGDVTFSRAILFPFVSVDWLLFKLGASPLFINNAWVIATVVVQALATLWLFRVLFPQIHKAIASFVGLLAVVNPYMLLTYHTPYAPTALSVALVPAVIAELIQLRQTMRPTRVVIFVFLALTMATGDNNPGVTMAEYLFLIPVLIILMIQHKGAVARIRYIAVTSLGFIAANFLWVLPALYYVRSNLGGLATATAASSLTTLKITAQYSGISNSGRLIGDYLFYNAVAGRPYIAQGQEYAHAPWLVLATWILPTLAVLGVILLRRDRVVVVIGYFTLAGLIMAKGGGVPFGAPFEFVVNHVSVLQAFRDSFSKFGWVPMYGYSLLAGVCLAQIWRIRKRASAIGLSCVCVAGPAIGSYPVLTGGLFASQAVTSVPARYYAMSSWFNSLKGPGAVLELPVSPYAYDAYRWGYVGAGLLPNMIRRPFVSRMFDLSSAQTQQIDNAFQSYSTDVGTVNIANLLKMYGIKYVIDDPSIDPQYFSPSFSSEMLPHAPPGMQLAKKFGSILVFKVKTPPNPIIYAPNRVYSSSQTWTQTNMLRLCNLQHSTCTSTAFVSNARKHAVSGASVVVSGAFPSITKQSRTYVAVPRASIVNAQTGIRELATAEKNSELGVMRQPIRLCANANMTAQKVQVVQNPSILGTSLLSILYSHASGNPILYVTVPNSHGYLQLALPRSTKTHDFTRLLDFGDAPTVTVKVALSSRPTKQCITLNQVALEPVPASLPLHLLPTPNNLDATPMIVAANPQAISASANSTLQRVNASDTVTSMTGGSDTAKDWNFVDVISTNSGLTADTSLSQSVDGMQRFSVRNGDADVHEMLGGLLPGGVYRLTFRYRTIAGPAPNIVLYDDQGRVLSSELMSNSHSMHSLSIDFKLPPNTATVTPYVYVQGGAGATSIVELSSLKLQSDNVSSYLTLRGGENVKTPRAVNTTELSSTKYRVSVSGAPRHYLLVMNSTYSNEWKLTSNQSNAQITHIVVNQGENGWDVSGGSANQMLTVTYSGNDFVAWGYLGSGVALLMSLTLAIATDRRRKIPRMTSPNRAGNRRLGVLLVDVPRAQALMLGLAFAGAVSYLLNLALHGNTTLTRVNLGVTICLLIGWAVIALTIDRSDQSTDFVSEYFAIPVAEISTIGYSIIVPTFNRASDVCQLVETIVAFIESEIPGQTAEVIVVDDGSTDSTVADLALVRRAHATSINVVSQKNSGVASARNHGALEARGMVLIYIDSDCVPQRGWLSSLAQSAKKGGVAYTRVEGERIPYYPLEVSPYGAKFPGASFAVHRDDYLRLGGMSELFGHHLEDSDFYLKCVEGGLEVVSVKDAVIWHPLRSRSMSEIWRNAQLHSYDALLLRRHGKSSYPFLRNAFAGVNVGPYYGTTLTAFVLLGEGVVASFFPANGNSIPQWLFLNCVAGVVYITGVVACAIYLRVPILLWPRYFGAVITYMTGSVVGRVRGSWKYRTLAL